MKAEEEIIGLNRQIIKLEEGLRKISLEREHAEDQKKKVYSDLQTLARTHEDLKAKSLELISRMSKSEADNTCLREEKSKLVENILALQRNHQEELQIQREQLDSLTEKMYILNLEHENKQTVLELEKKFEREKEAYRDEIFRLKQLNDEQLSRIQQLGGNISEQNNLISELSQTEKHYFEEKDRAKSLQQEVYSLNTNLKEAQQKIEKLTKETFASKQELETTQKERAAARNECRELSQSKFELQSLKGDQESQIKKLHSEIEQLNQSLEVERQKVLAGEELRKDFEDQQEKNNEILKLSKKEITDLQVSLDFKQKELSQIEADKKFLLSKIERLEDQLFAREKSFLRHEAEKDLNTDEAFTQMYQENSQLKEEIISKDRV